jgi:hypothetical protein
VRQAALGQKSAASFIRRTQLIGCSVVGGAKCLTLTEETTDDYKGHCCYRFWNPGHIPHVGVFSGGGVDLEARQFLGLRLLCSRINRSFEIT